ncbi:hypothetical protein JCM8547_002664 [Rhodosporidiobolus lusitaniae]
MEELPQQYAQLKYVLFSWVNTPLLKKDGLAKAFFRSKVTISTLASSLGGFPLTVYEAVAPPSGPSSLGVPELFLSEQDCSTLLALLADQMGPSRAQASWKPTAWHRREALERFTPGGRIYKHSFTSQAQLEHRFAELKDQADWAATKPYWVELKRAQQCWKRMREGAIRGEMRPLVAAVDIETWEVEKDTITEVGVASARPKLDGTVEEKTEHFVVEENAHHRNGRYCPDARDHFQLGQTVTLPSSSIASHLRSLFSAAQPSSDLSPSSSAPAPALHAPPPPDSPVFLLLHDARSDVKSLAQLSLQMSLCERTLPSSPTSPPFTPPPRTSFASAAASKPNGSSRPPLPADSQSCPAPAAFLLDTQRLYAGWTRRKKQARLSDACQALGVTLPSFSPTPSTSLPPPTTTNRAPHSELAWHNAGNDAYATLNLFLRLMEMDIGDSEHWVPDSMRMAGMAGT